MTVLTFNYNTVVDSLWIFLSINELNASQRLSYQDLVDFFLSQSFRYVAWNTGD